jgi:BT1 family
MSILLTQISVININPALDYYYTATDSCVPNGPNFDYTYYLTINGIVGSVTQLLALLLYQRCFGNWRFRPAIYFTIVIGALASIFDLIIINRWNVTVLGISGRSMSRSLT